MSLLGAALLAVVLAGKFHQNRVSFPGEHAVAPEFSLTDLNGSKLQLSSYQGKVVLLDFWATWCDPCRDEIPQFVELQKELGPRGLQIIGISMDDEAQPAREFYTQYKMNYPVAMGDANIGNLYGGILGVPVAFMIGRDGRIYAKHVGATSAQTFADEAAALLEKRNGAATSTTPRTSTGD